ncbi:MAG TPA: hypothetical protein VNW47_03215 [Terriglobales bacterium]|jgi:hypothetical protein|nr:hypothetical protein [Terriglobales bacterium]
MSAVDPAGEWRELAERYHQMRDPELVALARQRSELTDLAQQALTQEISYRKLIIPPEEDPKEYLPPPKPDRPDPDSHQDGEEDPYAEERALVEIRTVWSLADARQIEWLLNRADIPFFMGPEKAPAMERVTSDFSQGVSVQIMRIGRYWAQQALQSYAPVDEPEPEVVEEPEEVVVKCPRCRSTDVVLGRLVPDSTSRYEWTCDACGYEWEDDGVAKAE